MFIGKRRHEIITMIVIRLEAKVNPFIITGLFRRLDEILREELFLLVEVVSSALA